MINQNFFSPFGVDLFCLGKKFLIFNLVSRNLKTKYHRSILGLFWTLLSPLSMTLIYYFAFKVVLKVQHAHYLSIITCGVLAWNFFAQTLNEGTDSLVSSWGLISKIPIPLSAFPLSGALTNLTSLLLAFPVLLGVAILDGCSIGASIFWIPIYYLLLFIITFSLSYGFSVLFVYFRDFKHILAIILQAWFYMTPVVYAQAMVPEKYKWIVYINPIGSIFQDMQTILVQGTWPNIQSLSLTLCWAIFLLFGIAFLDRHFFQEVIESI